MPFTGKKLPALGLKSLKKKAFRPVRGVLTLVRVLYGVIKNVYKRPALKESLGVRRINASLCCLTPVIKLKQNIRDK